MVDESGGEPRRGGGCGVGARLRDARERTGMTLAQAAQRLHLTTQTLEALEAERFDVLGAPIYVKSYLGRYAELLGESPEALQDLLGFAAALPQPDLTRIPHAPPAPHRPALAAGLVLGGLAMVALAWWGWSYRHSRLAALVRNVPVSAQQPASSPPAPLAVAPAATPGVAVVSGPSAAPMRGVSAAEAPTTEPGAVRITLSFPAASWVSVSDATGRSLYRGMVGAGALRTLVGPAPLHVVLGFADGVTLTANGRAAPIAAYVGRDHAVSIDVSAAGQVSPEPRRTGG